MVNTLLKICGDRDIFDGLGLSPRSRFAKWLRSKTALEIHRGTVRSNFFGVNLVLLVDQLKELRSRTDAFGIPEHQETSRPERIMENGHHPLLQDRGEVT